MAGGDRGPGLGLPVPRLERADHRRVLRPQCRLAHPRRRAAHRTDRQQLLPDQLQLRPHPARLAGAEGAGGLPRHPGGGRAEPRALLGARLGPGAGLPPHHPAARQPAGQADSSSLGPRRLRAPLRPPGRRDVAARDGGRPRDARPAGRSRRAFHRPRAAPGEAGTGEEGERRVEGRRRRADRSLDPLRGEAPVGAADRRFLLRRRDLAGGGVRGAAGERRALRRPADVRRARRPRARPAGEHRDRWRDLRPPPPPWRDGPLLRPPSHRGERPGEADQLRRVPGGPSARARSGDRREHRLELRPRGGPLARGLRLPHRRGGGLDAGVAGAAAPGPRLAARRAGAALGARGRRALRRPLGGPGRLRRRAPRPLARAGGRLPGALLGGLSSRGERPGAGAEAAGAAAACHADVHELRLVLQ